MTSCYKEEEGVWNLGILNGGRHPGPLRKRPRQRSTRILIRFLDKHTSGLIMQLNASVELRGYGSKDPDLKKGHRKGTKVKLET